MNRSSRVSYKRFRFTYVSILSLTLLAASVLSTSCGFTFNSNGNALLALGVGAGHGGNQPNGLDAATKNINTLGGKTVSNWLGTNISGDFVLNDLTSGLNGFNTAQVDAKGFPLPGVSAKSSTDVGFHFFTGDYKISYKGTGTLDISGVDAKGNDTWAQFGVTAPYLINGWTRVGDEYRGVVHFEWVPGFFGATLDLIVTNQPGQSVTDIHMYLPGVDYNPPGLFVDGFLRALGPFKQMRFMDWMGTNGSKATLLSDFVQPVGIFGVQNSLDAMMELINETGKDAWICMPEKASQPFWKAFAGYLVQKLDFDRINSARALQGDATPFHIIIEYSNETWAIALGDSGTTINQISASNPSRYDGAYTESLAYGDAWYGFNVLAGAQVSVDLLIQSSLEIKKAFNAIGHPETIQTVFAGWQIAPGYTAAGLEFVKKNYGQVSKYVDYVGAAGYFGSNDSSGSISNIFLNFPAGIDGTVSYFPQFAKMIAEYGVKYAAYEGGSGLGGSDNVHNIWLANYDRRMYDQYDYFFKKWKYYFGESRFNHFSLSDILGRPEGNEIWGFWMGITSVLDDPTECSVNVPQMVESSNQYTMTHYCPKYRSFFEQITP